jgi:hypothetical protein
VPAGLDLNVQLEDVKSFSFLAEAQSSQRIATFSLGVKSNNLNIRRKEMKKLFTLFIGFMVLAGCATKSGLKYEGVFVPKELVNKFEKVDDHRLRWMRPGHDFAKYNKFMVDYVIFALAPDSEYKGINADEMKKLADAASLALVNSIKEKYEVVSEPGPDVARVRFAISDLKQSSPAMSAVTSVVPVGLAFSLVKKGTSDEWAGGGLTKGEVMILDSQTNQVIAAGYGDYSAQFSQRFTTWGSVEDAFKKWGEGINKTLTEIKTGTFMKEKAK